MIPGINFRNAVRVVNHDYFCIALDTSSICAASRDALAHAARRNVEDFTYALFRYSQADFSEQTCAIRDILYRRTLAVPKQATEQEEEQRGDNYSTGACQHQR